MKEEQTDILDKPFDYYLFMGVAFTSQMNAAGVLRIKDLQHITLLDMLKIKAMTVARLRRIAEFMAKYNICFKQAANQQVSKST
jgi:hypothetical protein